MAILVCGTWVRLVDSCPPSARGDQGSVRDWVGVRVVFNHEWITGFLWWSGTVTWTDDAVMRVEPNYDS